MAFIYRYPSGLFKQGRNAVLGKISYLDNFPGYMKNIATDNYNELLNELNERQFYKPQDRPPYLAQMIRYALHLRYTSFQAYKLLLEKFPMPNFPILLQKIQKGGIDSLKALRLIHKIGSFSQDCILMVDEMYSQKTAEYQSGEYIGEDDEGEL